MSEVPPPPNAPYYRGPQTDLDPLKLRMLKEGYFGLNNVFLLNIVLAIGSNAAFRTSGEPGIALIFVGVMFVVIALLTYPQNKKIGEGLGWAPGNAILASVLMGLNSALCCGIIGYIIVQNMAAKGMKVYGIQGGAFGIKKSVVEARIQEIERGQTFMPPPVV